MNKKKVIKKSAAGAVKQKPNSKTLVRLFPFLIVLVTIILYLPATRNGWTNWDDTGYVLENNQIKNLNTNTAKEFFTTTQVMGNYHPLTLLSLAIDWKFSNDNAKTFHITSLVFHLLNTILVYFFVLLLLKNAPVAAIVSLLFAIHPAHTESVAWVSERKDVLYVFFYLISMCMYLFYVKSKTITTYMLCLFAFVLSLLSKGQAVTLPVALLLIDYFMNRKWEWKVLLEKLPFFLLSLLFGLLAVNAQALNKSIADVQFYTVSERIVFTAYALFSYLYKSVWPVPLSAFYPYPIKEFGWLVWASPVLLLLIASLVAFRFRKNRLLLFGLGFFLVNIILLLQVLPVGAALMADRYTYLSYLGLFIIVAQLFLHFYSTNKSNRLIALVLLFSLFIFYGVLAADRIKVWKNSETLWRDTLKKYKTIPSAYNNLGSYLQKNNRTEEAFVAFNEAIRLQEKFPEALINRSAILRTQGKTRESIEDCNKALTYSPDNIEALTNRGIAYSIAGVHDSAFRDFSRILELAPDHYKSYGNMGNLFDMRGMTDSALWAYTRAIEINKNYFDCYGNRSRTFLKINKFDEALNDINIVISEFPDNGKFYTQRVEIYVAKNDFENALKDAEKAQQLGFAINPAYVEMIKSKIREGGGAK